MNMIKKFLQQWLGVSKWLLDVEDRLARLESEVNPPYVSSSRHVPLYSKVSVIANHLGGECVRESTFAKFVSKNAEK